MIFLTLHELFYEWKTTLLITVFVTHEVSFFYKEESASLGQALVIVSFD